jgi:hypothetical protein
MDAHGDDPLLLYATARALELSGSPNAAVPYLQAAVDGFQTVNYPRQQAWQAAARLAVLAPKAGLPANPETNGLAVQWFTTAVQEQLPPGQERAFLAAVRRQVAPGGYRGLDKLVYTLAPQPGPNQWVLQVLAGDQEIQDGWAARGTGWASSVTAEGWKKLTECVAQAARDYEAAYALHPEFPEAPTGMITETMGSEDSSPEMERMWFDRAVAAQIDWVPAYDKLAYGSSPRWGGSLELMRALADECLAVPRYDTDVPSNYFYVLKRIAVEEDQRGIWQEPGVYSNLKKVFEGLIAAPEHAAEVPVWATRYAAIAYLTGNLPDAAQAFRLAGPRVDEHVFQELTKQTISQVRPQVPGAGGP